MNNQELNWLASRNWATYRAFGYSSLERILAQQGTPKPSWQQLSESEQEAIAKLTDSKPIPPRHSQEYQELFYGEKGTSSEKPSESPQHEPQEDNQEPGSSGAYCELDCGTIGYFRNEYPLSMEEGIHWLLQSRLSNTKSI